VLESRVEPGGVPARLYRPPGASALVLLGHGGGHGKDSPRFVDLSRRVAEGTGLAVLCIDAVDHGERRPAAPASGGALPAAWHSRVAPQMVADWRAAAAALADVVGPAVGYVGFSMGAMFGIPTVAALPSIVAAVFVVGGVPSGPWIDDPGLRPLLLEAARSLGGRDVLFVNKIDDELVPVAGARELFEAIPDGGRKRMRLLPGPHDEWPDAAIDEGIDLLRAAAGRMHP
jgi:dienelactone hydrolase